MKRLAAFLLIGSLFSACVEGEAPVEDTVQVFGDSTGKYKVTVEEDIKFTSYYNLNSSVESRSVTISIEDYLALISATSSVTAFLRVAYDEVSETASVYSVDAITEVETPLFEDIALEEDGTITLPLGAHTTSISPNCGLESEQHYTFGFSTHEVTVSDYDQNGAPEGEVLKLDLEERNTFISTSSWASDNCAALLTDLRDSIDNQRMTSVSSHVLYTTLFAGAVSFSNVEHLREVAMNASYTLTKIMGTSQSPLTNGPIVTRQQELNGRKVYDLALKTSILKNVIVDGLKVE